MASSIHDNLQSLRERIARAAAAAGRDPRGIRLLPVTKGQPISTILTLRELGFDCFGENYLNELRDKKAALGASAPSFSFIGVMQSNKVKAICELADEIQSIPSLRYLQLVHAALAKGSPRPSPLPVWLVVNAADEATKTGLSFAELDDARRACESLPLIQLEGLMAIPPAEYGDWDLDGQGVPPLYDKLRRAATATGRGRLSLGMSDDLELAVAAGSDCLRIGTALCGLRTPRPATVP